MKSVKYILIVLAISLGAILFFAPWSAATKAPVASAPAPSLSHAQKVWLGALEWCESHGDPTAINPEDNDGTPSYGPYQFKPDTLIFFSKKYLTIFIDKNNVMEAIMDYSVQRATVEAMVLHREDIRWDRQFPGCVKKLGPPPA